MRLGEENGLCFNLIIPKKFSEFENAILRGKPDFVLLNPYHQVMVSKTPGYIPLVRDEHSKLAGVIVVNKQSPIQTLEQLDGKTLAFPAPNAYVASLLLRAILAKKGIHITPKYVGSHSNVYRAVALEDLPAGGGANTTLSNEPISLQSQLRVLFTSPYYVPHPFSAHPRVSAQVRKKVIEGFLKMYDDQPGRQMLKTIQMEEPFAADYIRDYQLLENLNLENFVEVGR
jgi:phosphonate transport system substrate-binding protein